MFYEEQVVNGVLCWRNDPRDEFTPYTIEQLTRKYLAVKKYLELTGATQ